MIIGKIALAVIVKKDTEIECVEVKGIEDIVLTTKYVVVEGSKGVLRQVKKKGVLKVYYINSFLLEASDELMLHYNVSKANNSVLVYNSGSNTEGFEGLDGYDGDIELCDELFDDDDDDDF